MAIAHRHVLGLDLAPLSAPNHIAGWEIVDSDQDTITLRAAGPLLDGLLVARRTSPSSAVLETIVRYRVPVPAPLIWAAVAPVTVPWCRFSCEGRLRLPSRGEAMPRLINGMRLYQRADRSCLTNHL